MEKNLPPGFRFHPTDEELIAYYLRRKAMEFGFATRAIADVDINKCEPWDLPGKATMGEKEWYFFSMKDRKYPTGMRTNRATESGYWKTTGKDKEIFHCGALAGMKKTLVFYKGRAPRGEKTSWVMHEYRLHSKYPYKSKEEWVVCRVFKKSNIVKRQESNSLVPLPHLLDSPCNAAFSELGEFDASILNSFINNPNTHNHRMQTNDNSSSSSCNNNNNNKVDINKYMNWILASESASQPSVPWMAGTAPGCLQGAETLRVLSLSLKAHQARESIYAANSNPCVGHADALFGMDSTSTFEAAIAKGTESAQPRSFNQEPGWGNY